VTHNESISISDYYSLVEGGTVHYRPTVHYAYHPCDDAVLSLHELAGKNWALQAQKRLMMNEIVSGIDELGEATLSYNSLKHWDEAGRLDQLIGLSRAVGRTRAFGDLWSYMLLAEGAIDIAAEFDVKPWDVAALYPIVREAGGTVTDAGGGDRLDTLSIVATNGALHGAVLDFLSVG